MPVLRIAIISLAASAIAGLFFLWVRRRRASSGVGEPQKAESFVANLPPEKVLEVLRREAGRAGYEIEKKVPTYAAILLSEPASAVSWGFYFPISLKPLDLGRTEVTIGIQSKALQFGPIVRKRHRACVTAAKAALGLSAE
jgi:hypothetical protein